MRRCLQLIAAFVVGANFAPLANAHLVSTELGPFYDGAAHPLVTPEDLLVIAALAALSALRGAEGGRRALLGLCGAWGLAAAVAFAVGGNLTIPPLVTAGLLVVTGAACALKLAPPSSLLMALGVVIGIVHGTENGLAARNADGIWLSAFGIVTGVTILAILMTALGVHLERRGATLALRVAGSWIAAIGLLFAGWQLSGLAS